MLLKKINMKNKTNDIFKRCPKFENCSSNVCPLDLEAHLKIKLPGENDCPFTIKKRSKEQKGKKLLIPINCLNIIPRSNVKMLHKRNQRQWHNLKNGTTQKI